MVLVNYTILSIKISTPWLLLKKYLPGLAEHSKKMWSQSKRQTSRVSET